MFKSLKKLNSGNDSLTWIIIAISGLYLVTISLLSKGIYGDTDSITHYQVARFAFQNPELFFDHWGKPLFTILSSPFAQLGFQGSILFNILCGLTTAWLIYKIASAFGMKYGLIAIPFTLFAPIYIVTMFTSLTEILFSLVLVTAIYLFVKGKTTLSAFIISFIPFARTEGMMFLIVFLVAFILVRKWRAIPFLMAGMVLFGIAGYWRYRDLFWFFTEMPYSSKGSEIYGHGSFWYYILHAPRELGWPLLILSVIGLGVIFHSFLMTHKDWRSFTWLGRYYLVTGSLFAFLLAHSFLWWQGLMGVLASERFMACITPLAAIFALAGLDKVISFAGNRPVLKNVLVLVIVITVAYFPYRIHKMPLKLADSSYIMHAAAEKMKSIDSGKKHIYYFDPKLAFFMDRNPFDNIMQFYYLPDLKRSDLGIPDSAYLVWDEHFAEFEVKIKLEEMLQNTSFRFIDGFTPPEDTRFFTGQNLMAIIFQKVPERQPGENWVTLDSLDFETADAPDKLIRLSDSVQFTGLRSDRVNSAWPYSFSIKRKLTDLPGKDKTLLLAQAMIYLAPGAQADKVFLVLSVHGSADETYRYIIKQASYFNPPVAEWFDISLLVPVQKHVPEDGYIKLYIWYPGENNIYVDDLLLKAIPVSQ